MPNTYVNKVIYGNQTLIDLTPDDVTVNSVLSGIKFHLPSGQPATGSCNYDSYTGDADATAAMILYNKTAYVNATKITGTMPNIGAVTGCSIGSINGALFVSNEVNKLKSIYDNIEIDDILKVSDNDKYY